MRIPSVSVWLLRRNWPRGNVPLEMVRAGLHCSRRMSRQMEPLALILWEREARGFGASTPEKNRCSR